MHQKHRVSLLACHCCWAWRISWIDSGNLIHNPAFATIWGSTLENVLDTVDCWIPLSSPTPTWNPGSPTYRRNTSICNFAFRRTPRFSLVSVKNAATSSQHDLHRIGTWTGKIQDDMSSVVNTAFLVEHSKMRPFFDTTFHLKVQACSGATLKNPSIYYQVNSRCYLLFISMQAYTWFKSKRQKLKSICFC